MGAILWKQGRQVRRTRYRRVRWQSHDTVAAIGCGVSLAAVIAGRLFTPQTLAYSPYPPNSLLPPFNPYVGAALLLLALPAGYWLIARSAAPHGPINESDGTSNDRV
jgi:hypothetical protein